MPLQGSLPNSISSHRLLSLHAAWLSQQACQGTNDLHDANLLLRKRLDAKDARLRLFYEQTAYGRWAARQATWASLVLYLSSLAVLGFEMLPLPAAIVCACLLLGALV